MGNPFIFGNPIEDPQRFFGRQQEIHHIVDRLLSSAHESTSIVGERRIGKTSLLMYLSNPKTAELYNITPDRFCLVYIDFQGLNDITPHRFWQRVLKKIADSLNDSDLKKTLSEFSQKESFDLFDLEDIFVGIKRKNLHVVLFLDEFDAITRNNNFGMDFYGGLRSLAIHYNLSLVTATCSELVDLCYADDIKSSPFFNIFSTIVLRPFRFTEMNDMLKKLLQGSNVRYNKDDVQLIFQLSGGYPFFSQMAASLLFECKENNAPRTKISDLFINQAEPHFDYFWRHCNESKKISMLVMLIDQVKNETSTVEILDHLNRLYPRARIDILDLYNRGLVIEDTRGYRLFSSSFETWIRNEITASSTEESDDLTAEEWLKSEGYDDVSLSKKILPSFKKEYWLTISKIITDISIEVGRNAALDYVKSIITK